MPVELTGRRLTLDEVVRVARGGERVAISSDAVEHMRRTRAVVERASAEGTPAYGVTTGVGMRRDARVDAAAARAFNRSAIAGHLVGLGPLVSDEVARASLLRLANGLVAGYQGVRPEVAGAVVEALNDGETPAVRLLGTVGQADLAQNAELADGVLGELVLEAGEALALLASNAFSTAQAALAVADARAWLDWLDVAAALDFEAFRANVGALHAEVAAARPYAGIADTIERMRMLLDGSTLWEPGSARFLQDPLTFRCVPQLHGAARDALRFVEEQLAIELNAHQGNPLVVLEEQRLVSVGNFDSQPLAAALDFLRIALAPTLTAAVERTLEAAEPAIQRTDRGPGRGRRLVAGRALRVRRRGSGDRRGGAPARAAGVVRAGLDDAGVGGRGSHRPVVARRAPDRARWSTSAHAWSRSSSWWQHRRSTYEGRRASGRARWPRERSCAIASLGSTRTSRCRYRSRSSPWRSERAPHRRDDLRRPPASLARGVRGSVARQEGAAVPRRKRS